MALDLSMIEADAGAKNVKLGTKLFEGQSTIKTFVLPSSLRTIGGSCFRSTGANGKIVVSEGLTALGSQSFYKVGFSQIILPNTLKSISAQVFQQMTVLTPLTIPRSVTSVAANTFDRTTKIKTIYRKTCPKSLGLDLGFDLAGTHNILPS